MNNMTEGIIKFQPYEIFNIDNQKYLFDGSSASIYKIDSIVLEILGYEGKTIEEIYDIFKDKIDEQVYRDTLDKMMKSSFVVGNESVDEVQDRPYLKGVTLMLVQSCNLACQYCFGSEGEYFDKGIMQEKVALDTIDYLIEKSGNENNLQITFFGGEPLLCFELIECIVSYCKSKENTTHKKFSYSMTTNGTLLNDQINKFIIENRIGTMISIDGNAEQQNAKRYYKMGKGCYDEVIEKTAPLREKGYLSARATITDTNLVLVEVFEHLHSLGFRSIPMAPAYNLMTDDDYRVYVDKLYELCNMFKRYLKTDIVKAKKLRILWKAIKRIHKGAIQFTACGAGINGVAVDIHGNLYPCHRFVSNKEYIIGNIYKSNDKRKKFAEEANIKSHPKCDKCYLRLLCGGGCTYENYIEKGSTLDIFEKQCNETKVIYNNMIELYLSLSEKEKKDIFEVE